jgi:WD40 repeat protein
MSTLQPKAPANAPKELGKPVNPPCQVTRVRFSPDGKVLAAACTDGTVRRWDVAGTEPAELPALAGHSGWVTGLAFADESLLSADSWGRLTSWDSAGKQLWSVGATHEGWLRMLVVSRDTLATCGKDGFVRLWNPTDGKRLGEIDVKADTHALCFAPNGKTLFTGDLFGMIREHELPGGKVLRTLDAKELYKLDRIQDVGGVRCLLFDAAGKTLFVAGAVPSTGGFVQCTPLLVAFDFGTGKRLSSWKGANDNEGYVTDLAWHPDGYVVGTASGQPGQGKVFFWKPGDAAPFWTAAKPNVHSVTLSPDGTRIAAALTNANSAGNGRVKGKGGEYPANFSPIQFWQVPKAGG